MRTDFSDYSERDENLDYTARAYESFYEVVDDPYFLRKDQNAIYKKKKKKDQDGAFRRLSEKIYLREGTNGRGLSEYSPLRLSDDPVQ